MLIKGERVQGRGSHTECPTNSRVAPEDKSEVSVVTISTVLQEWLESSRPARASILATLPRVALSQLSFVEEEDADLTHQ